nr:hypothetical protein [Leucobacter soli]
MRRPAHAGPRTRGDRVGPRLAHRRETAMVAAALVLLLSSPGKRKAAPTQGARPLAAVAVLALGMAL